MRAIELETEIDENHEIHLKLPEAVQARKARVVVLYEENEPVGANKPSTQQDGNRSPREFGQFRGTVRMSDDFDEPLSDEFWLGGNP